MALLALIQTSGFRLGLRFLFLFGLASLIVFAFVYWQATRYSTYSTDDWLRRELAGLLRSTSEELANILAQRPVRDPEGLHPFALFDANGIWLAGGRITLPHSLPMTDQPFDFTFEHGNATKPFRGIVHSLPSGNVLLVAQDSSALLDFRDDLLAAMVSGAFLVLLLGLVGAAITGRDAIRRIDRVTLATERIVKGNLSERLPSEQGGGDLDRLTRVVNGMLDDIERLMHETKGVTDDIAHDLRTPLTRVRIGLERGRQNAESIEDLRAIVDHAIVGLDHSLTIITALLRIAEIEHSNRVAGFSAVALADIVREVGDLYEPIAEDKGVALKLDAPEEISVHGDRDLLFEAVANLVDNAVKFTPEGGRIELSLARVGDNGVVRVRDTGPGIAVNERDLVARRFYRSDRSRRTPGLGLGLSLVAAIIRLHGFRLTISSGPGCVVEIAGRASEASMGGA